MITRIEPEVITTVTTEVVSVNNYPFITLLVMLGVIDLCLAAIVVREGAASALALIGVFNGGLIAIFQFQTGKPFWGWALASTFIALALFIWDLASKDELWVASWVAALVGTFGSLLSLIWSLMIFVFGWRVAFDLDWEIPVGVFVTVGVVIVAAIVSLVGVRRWRHRTT